MPSTLFRPQLASLVRTPPTGDAWLHEIKYDGYRIGCHLRAGQVQLLSRSGLDWTAKLPAIAEAARRLRTTDALIDGEAAVVLPDGRTSFEALQRAVGDASTGGSARGAEADGQLVYFAFDLLSLNGQRLDTLPLEQRKAQLLSILGRPRPSSRLRYADHVIGQGAELFDRAHALGLEGIVSKRRDRPYRRGRSTDWVKAKCLRHCQVVIGGFIDQVGTPGTLGALLVGGHDPDGRLVYCGRVGTGFSRSVASELRAQLARLERRTSPFTPAPAGTIAGVHWTTPRLTAEVTFTEWTSDGQLRHPSFQTVPRGVDAQKVTLDPHRPADATQGSVTRRPRWRRSARG